MNKAEGVVLVLPELELDGVTHYGHYVPLIRRLAATTRVAVVVEHGPGPGAESAGALGPVELHVQRRRTAIGRAGELGVLLLRLRRRGYRAFFGSYSRAFGLVGGALGRVAGFRTAYWHCRSDVGELRLRREGVVLWLIFRLVNRVVTCTDAVASLYVSVFRVPRSKVVVVPRDVDADWFKRDVRPDRDERPTVLFVGRLSPPKGSRLLPAILQGVAEAMPEARFIVAGGGPDEARVREEIGRRLPDGRVELLGYVPNTEVASLMTSADVLLLPSLEEGFGRRLVEAMTCELPFVAADVGGVPEVAGPLARRYLFPPGDVSSAVDRVVEVLSDPELRQELAEEGTRRAAERYHPDVVAPLFLEAVCGDAVESRPIE